MVEPEQPARSTGRQKAGMLWDDGAAYGFVLAGIYFLVGVLFFYSGKSKILDGIGASWNVVPVFFERRFRIPGQKPMLNRSMRMPHQRATE